VRRPTRVEKAWPQKNDSAERSSLAARPVDRRVRRQDPQTTAFCRVWATKVSVATDPSSTRRFAARHLALGLDSTKAPSIVSGRALKSTHRSATAAGRRHCLQRRDETREGAARDHDRDSACCAAERSCSGGADERGEEGTGQPRWPALPWNAWLGGAYERPRCCSVLAHISATSRAKAACAPEDHCDSKNE
jgi:hypothetical protein